MKKIIKLVLIVFGVLFALIIIAALMPDKDKGDTKATTQPKVEDLQITLTNGRIFQDTVFNKKFLMFDVNVKNNKTKTVDPYVNFKLFDKNGASISQSSVYVGNENACILKLINTELRSGGMLDCKAAFQISLTGDYELEIYDGVFDSKPVKTIKIKINDDETVIVE